MHLYQLLLDKYLSGPRFRFETSGENNGAKAKTACRGPGFNLAPFIKLDVFCYWSRPSIFYSSFVLSGRGNVGGKYCLSNLRLRCRIPLAQRTSIRFYQLCRAIFISGSKLCTEKFQRHEQSVLVISQYCI